MTWIERWVVPVAVITVVACQPGVKPMADQPPQSITHFAEQTELFVEFPALVTGVESPFAVHLTRLPDWKPMAAGHVTVILSAAGAREERFDADAPQVPGIFRPVARPAQAGERQLTVLIEAEGLSDRHDLGAVTVHPTVADAAAASPADAARGVTTIPFLKEQQWRTDFGVSAVADRTLRASLPAYGALRARSDGEAHIAAPVTGRLVSAPEELPRIGMAVQHDQVLATIAPRVGTDTDPASLELVIERARLDAELAHRERVRLEGLFKDGAVPERRVLAARHEERDAETDLGAAQHRLAQLRGVSRAVGELATGRVTVRAPIAGTVTTVAVAPGEFVEEGRELFHLADLDRLWLEARIPEADIGRVRSADGASFEVEGVVRQFDVDAAGGGRVVALGGIVDAHSRTAPLVFEVPNPEHALRVGMFARIRVFTGETVTGPAVPVSAVVDDQGQEIVFVQATGEAFERRSVRVGVRDGEFVQVLDGLRTGDRVVTRGAYSVRLAAASGSVPAHGHAH